MTRAGVCRVMAWVMAAHMHRGRDEGRQMGTRRRAGRAQLRVVQMIPSRILQVGCGNLVVCQVNISPNPPNKVHARLLIISIIRSEEVTTDKGADDADDLWTA